MTKPFDISTIIRKLSYGDRLRPVRDWFVLLAVAAALVLVSVGWNVWLFQRVERGGTLVPDEASSAFDTASVESVRAVFEARTMEEARYAGEHRFVDPSR